MKANKLIVWLACLFASLSLMSQESRTKEVYYDYELIPTGRVLKGIDTAYSVILIVDSTDLINYSTISLVNEKRSSELSLLSQDESTRSKIESRSNQIRIDMQEWDGSMDWKVTAKRSDGVEVDLKHITLKDVTVQKEVSSRIKTRNLTFSNEEPIIEPEPPKAPEPVEPDTIPNIKSRL